MYFRFICNLSLIGMLILGCGFNDSDEKETDSVYATLNVSKDGNKSTHSVKGLSLCKYESKSDYFDAVFGTEGQLTGLSISLTGVSGTSGTSVCTLSEDSDSDPNGCSVLFKVPNSEENASGFDQYSNYDSIQSADKVVYSGSCTIKWNNTGKGFNGTIDCAGLVQTHRKSSVRNPIDNSILADLTDTTFKCDYK